MYNINNIFDVNYIQQQAQQQEAIQHHNQQIYNVSDSAKKLKDFLDSMDKIEPQYAQIANAEYCAIIFDYLRKHGAIR